MIKYNVKTVNDWLYNSNPIKGMYYNGRKVYRRFVANGQPTPPSFDGKWKATYSNGNVTSAQCGSSSEIRQYEINKTNLVSVEISDCVTSIGYYAFDGCRSLSSINIPDSVTSIGYSAFAGCRSVTSCTIGSGVTSIANQSFAYNSIIRKITIKAVIPPTIKSFTFIDTNNCPIYVPSQSVEAYKSADVWNTYASRIQPIS